ncbi:MAG: hypothetical protein VYC34_09990 [Planctomycetota bacterium]|nr:hypothetical protein [Planctomycetota bacterium]
MREATYLAVAAGEPIEIAVSQLAGDGGGALANVNRWRSQSDLDPIGPSELDRVAARLEGGASGARFLRLRGDLQDIIGAMIPAPDSSRTWFVKCTCSSAQADAIEADLRRFAASFTFDAAPPHPANAP